MLPGRKLLSAATPILPVALLAAMGVLLVLNCLHKHFAYDELDNLSYGYRWLTEGPSTPLNGQRMPALALNALACVRDDCTMEPLGSEFRRALVRAASMVFAIALGAIVYSWSRELYGRGAALLALTLYVLNPNFLAHGKQVTSDAATAFFTAAAIYAFWRFLQRPGRVRFLLWAAATTGALASKFTSGLLLPIFVLLALYERRRGGRLEGRPVGRSLAVTLAFGLAVVLGLNAIYLFDGSFHLASSYKWQSRAFQSLGSVPLPVPLPKLYALGLDYSSYLQENPRVGRGSNYVLGELNRDGRWYAFPLMILLKTPLAFFVLLALAARSKVPETARGSTVWLMTPFVVILGFFSLCVDAQLGIRYVLPAIPFLIVYAGRAASIATRRWGSVALGTLIGWNAASTLSYQPHSMCYFNELIGSRLNAYKFLADSNLDWEDRSWFIGWFRIEHPEMAVAVEPDGPRAGYVLVGANQLVDILGDGRFRWLRGQFEPIGHVGYSYLLFYVPPDRLEELRQK